MTKMCEHTVKLPLDCKEGLAYHQSSSVVRVAHSKNQVEYSFVNKLKLGYSG